MKAVLLWVRIAAGCLVAVAAFSTLHPAEPARTLPAALAMPLGAVAGIALFCILGRARPALPRVARDRAPVVAGTAGVILAWAAVEETLWRWLLVGVLIPRTGLVVAVPISAAAFAAWHRRGRREHLLTGTVFGGLYAASGSLAAAVAAHAAYNVSIAATLERRPSGAPA